MVKSGFGNDQGFESRNSMVMLEQTCAISLIHDSSVFVMLFSLTNMETFYHASGFTFE